MSYTIRTKSGERGPFSVEQLQALYDQGKIPEHLNVIEAASGQSLPLSEVLWADGEVLDDWDEGNLIEDGYADESPPEDELHEEPSRPVAPQRAAGRRAPARASSPGRTAGRTTGARGPTTRARGAGSRTGGRQVAGNAPYRRKKSQAPAIIMIVVLVALVGGAIWYLGYYDKKVTKLSSLYGTWVADIDREKLKEQAVKEAIAEGESEEEAESTAEFGVALMGAVFSKMKLKLDANTMQMEITHQNKTTRETQSYTSKRTADGWFVLTPTSGATSRPLVIQGRGKHLYIKPGDDELTLRFKRG